MKLDGGLFGKGKRTNRLRGSGTREDNKRWICSKYIVCMYKNVIMKLIILYN
jgi:hypothetical protein